MSYLVLARKWRPQNFNDVVGQEYITTTLRNAVETGKIAHALLFSGPRGVGKTSTARVVAKCLNCIEGPTPEPCLECNFCREISEGKSLDVIEIDAASHTGVNDVREIIENIKYLPSSGKTKVYIVDEAHMLSQSAFNALLKTLEEPPPHVLFILATTEVHKIPVTILSRCQRYDFKKIPADQIKKRLESVAAEESLEISDETLYLLSREADGSVRDALSLLDQLIATFGTEIDHEEALSTLGVLDRAILNSTLKSILDKDPKRCVELLGEASDKGISPKRFAEDLLKTLRNTLVIKTCGKGIVSELSEDDQKDLEKVGQEKSVETLEMLFSRMLDGAEQVQRSFYPRMSLEVTLVKLSLLPDTVPLDDIIGQIEALSRKLGEGNPNSERPQRSRKETRGFKEGVGAYDPKPVRRSPNKRNMGLNTNSDIGELIKFVRHKSAITAKHLGKADKIRVGKRGIKIEFGSKSFHSDSLQRKETKENLRKYLKEFYSKNMRVKIEVNSGSSTVTDGREPTDKNRALRDKIRSDPNVNGALEIFGGKVINIKTK